MEECQVRRSHVVEVDFGVAPGVVVFGDVLWDSVRIVFFVPRHVETHGHVRYKRDVHQLAVRVCKSQQQRECGIRVFCSYCGQEALIALRAVQDMLTVSETSDKLANACDVTGPSIGWGEGEGDSKS